MSNEMRIGEVAAQAGVNVQTLRYYERRGLLEEPERRPSGYRTYAPEAVHLVRFIKKAQGLGFTLREVQELLRLRESRPRNGAQVRRLAETKIQDIDMKIRRLQPDIVIAARPQDISRCIDGGSFARVIWPDKNIQTTAQFERKGAFRAEAPKSRCIYFRDIHFCL